MRLRRLAGREHIRVLHHLQHHLRAIDRGDRIGRGRVMRGRLDQAGDDRRLGHAHLAAGVAEEFAARGIDAVSAAAEIDAVEIEFEDLLLGEFPLHRQREDDLADLAAIAVGVGEEDVAGQLLGDGRSALQAAPLVVEPFGDVQHARDTDRVDARMAVEAPILHRDDRIAHSLRDAIIGQPVAIARPERHEHRTVCGMDSDRLAVGLLHHAGEGRQGGHRHQYGDDQRCDGGDRTEQEDAQDHAADPAGASGFGFSGWGRHGGTARIIRFVAVLQAHHTGLRRSVPR